MNLGAVERMEFIERYVGLMSDGDMALELHIPIEKVREIRREFSQKCWSCKNACDQTKCSWVRRGIYPSYVDIADDGHIIRCKRYEEDARREHEEDETWESV